MKKDWWDFYKFILLLQKSEMFVDTTNAAIVKKNVKPVINQERNESRFTWRNVTAALA